MSEDKNNQEKYLSPHERRLKKHQEKNVSVTKELEHKKPKSGKKKGNRFLTYLIIALIAAAIFQLAFPPPKQNVEKTSTSLPTNAWEVLSRPIVGDNWQADYSVYLCGEKQQSFPQINVSGISTDGNGKIIIKPTKQDETGSKSNLGKFFDNVGQRFSETELLDKKNGDVCLNTNQTGRVKLVVNDKENVEFRNYVPRDGDKIEFRFE